MSTNSVRNIWARFAAVSAVGVALILASGVKAQEATAASSLSSASPTPTTAGSEVQTMAAVSVTGTFLPPSALAEAGPVTLIDSTAVQMTGEPSIQEVLKRLDTGFTGNGNLGMESNNITGGGGGEAYLSLHNLTTLVLLDGNRIAASAFNSFYGGNSVNVSTIPLGMIDHIEILKDGASTVYGSDAIGGVVNVITKKNYQGLEVFAGYGGDTLGMEYHTKTYGLTAGASTDTASITFGASYNSSSGLYSTQRQIAHLTLAQVAAAGGQPGQTQDAYYSGSFPGRVGNDVVAGSSLALGAPGYNAGITTPVVWSSPSAIQAQTLTQLEAKGIYVPLSTTPLYAQASNSTALFNTANFNTALMVPSDNRQFLINGDNKFWDGKLELTTEILYSQTINGGDTLAPAPLASLTGNNLTVPANNPYNPFGVVVGVGQPAGTPTVRSRLIENGDRTATNQGDTYDVTEHLKGKLTPDINFDLSANYSRVSWLANVLGGANGAVMNQLMVPLIGANGGYVYNSAGKPLSSFVDPATGNQDLPVYNIFGLPGSNDPATVKAYSTTLFESGVSELKNYMAVIDGKIIELPAGNLTFSLGYQFLRQDLAFAVDGLYSNGLALGYGSASSFSGGTIYSNSVFAELGIPILAPSQNIPGFHSLDLTLSGRSETLNTGPKSTVPKIGLKWQPIDNQLTIRATYGRGFISPTTFSLFGPPLSSAPTFSIQEGNGASGSGGVVAGAPIVSGQFVTGNATQTANPKLPPSKSQTVTAGVVFSPKGIKGLNISAGYYNIRETGIGSTDYTSIFKSLNALGSASPYASGFSFADGTTLKTTAPNQVTSTNVGNISTPLSQTGYQWTDGVDIDLDYTLPIPADFGRTKIGVTSSVLFNYYAANNATAPEFQYARQYTGGSMAPNPQGNLPGYIIKPYLDWTKNGLSINVDVNYLPKVSDSGSLFGGPNSPDYSAPNSETLNGKVLTIPSYITADFSVNYDLGRLPVGVPVLHKALEHASITLGVNDAFNRLPPFVPSSLEDNTDEINYSIVGRFVFAQITKKY